MSWEAAAISAGGSLVGGLIGASRSSGEQRANRRTTRDINNQMIRENKRRIQTTVSDAKKAGINPLTALRGGAANYSTHLNNPPALASPNFIGDAISNAANAIAGVFEEREDQEREKLELQIMQEQLDQLQQGKAVVAERDFGYSIPSVTTYTGVDNAKGNGRPVLHSGGVHGNSPGAVKDEIPSILVPWRAENGEIVMLPNPDLPDADQYIPAIAGGASASVQETGGFGPNGLPPLSRVFDVFDWGGPKRPKRRPQPKDRPQTRPPALVRKDFMRQNYPTVFD